MYVCDSYEWIIWEIVYNHFQKSDDEFGEPDVLWSSINLKMIIDQVKLN